MISTIYFVFMYELCCGDTVASSKKPSIAPFLVSLLPYALSMAILCTKLLVLFKK